MRTVKSDLKEFYTWLTDDKLVQKRTATVYCSNVRAVLAACSTPGTVTQEDVDKHFVSVAEATSSSVLTSWKKYCEWVRSHAGFVLPEPVRNKKERTKSPQYALPLGVAAALYFCIKNCDLRLSEIEKMVWGLVIKTRLPGRTFIRLKPTDKEAYAIPDECAAVLREFAKPQNSFAPLVPWFPGCQFAMSVTKIKKEILAYERLRIQAEQEGVTLDCFDPFKECVEFTFGDRPSLESYTSTAETPTVEATVRPQVSRPSMPKVETEAKIDVPLSQAITTADLLARITPRRTFIIDFEDVEKRTTDYPGDWRYLFGDEDTDKE
jgi:hypothetical protein